MLQGVAGCCRVLQGHSCPLEALALSKSAYLWCSVLQGVAGCCRVLQGVVGFFDGMLLCTRSNGCRVVGACASCNLIAFDIA